MIKSAKEYAQSEACQLEFEKWLKLKNLPDSEDIAMTFIRGAFFGYLAAQQAVLDRLAEKEEERK